MLVLSPLDLSKNELRQAQIQNLAAAPSSPVKGQLYYDTVANVLFFWNGTTWVSASGGTPPDATTSTKGIVQLAGDLAGTAASPQIAAGVITDAEVATANKDGAAATPGMRTLGFGTQQAMQGSFALSGISNNNPSITTITASNQRIINLGDPTGATDAANKQYVDGIAQGLDTKASVRAASTGNLTLSGAGQTIDGVVCNATVRVLVKNQTASQDNGIYDVASGAWTRSADMDVSAEFISAFVFVESGTVNADTGWVCTNDPPFTMGTNPVTWTQFSGAGSFVDGAGLLKTGNTVDVRVDGGTIQIVSDILQVAAGGIGATQLTNGAVDLGGTKVQGTLPTTQGGTSQQTAKLARETAPPNGLGAAGYYSSATHGAGTTITITAATHGLRASRGLVVQCRLEATGEEIGVDNTVAANGDVTVTFAASQSANTIRVVIVG